MSKKIEKLEYYTDDQVIEKLNELIDAHNSEVVGDEWPKYDKDECWAIGYKGCYKFLWLGNDDNNEVRNHLGIYRTKEEAEATLAKIKQFLNK